MQTLLRLILSATLLISAAITWADDLTVMERQLEDSVITTKIEAKFTKNHDLNPLKIFVSTQNGVVTLKGHVKNKEALIAAMQLAKTTTGVKQVECDDLEIKQVNTAITDTYITAKVEAAVLKAKVLDDESIPIVGINARTNNGEVTLSGQVKRNKSILAIIKRVSAVHGVKKIISQLTVTRNA